MEDAGYRAVIIRCEPTQKQKKLIDKNLQAVSKMTGISRFEFQKLLYHRFKEQGFDVSSRLIDLMVQRCGKTLFANKVLPLDERNYRIVKKDGAWFAEIQLRSAKNSRKEAKELIPIYRSKNKYYENVPEGSVFPAILFKQGADYFIAVTIPVEKRYEENRKTVYCGIDLNQRKHAASFYNPDTGVFEKNLFFDLSPIDRKIKEVQRKISAVQRGKRYSEMSEEEVQKIRELHETIRKVIEKGHGDFIAKLLKVADEYWEAGYNVVFVLEDLTGITKRVEKEYASFNRWLHSQWCYRKFAAMIDCRHYPVIFVDPRDTSKKCHRCGGELKIHGKHKRLVDCPHCGLKDFNRDLNAARNLVKKHLSTS